jgi:hypothetical protein
MANRFEQTDQAPSLATYRYKVNNMPVEAQLSEEHAKLLGAERIEDNPVTGGNSEVGDEQVAVENVVVKARRTTGNKARTTTDAKSTDTAK